MSHRILTIAAISSVCVVVACDDDDDAARTPITSTATAEPTTSTAPTADPTETAKPAPAPAPAPKPPEHAKLDEDTLKKEVTPHLGKNEVLAHPAFRGKVGPHDDAVVALVKSEADGPSKLVGFVVASGKKHDLPSLHDSWNLVKVPAIAFSAEADDDDDNEILVVGHYTTGVGPDGAKEFPFITVLDWDGKKFVRLKAVERLLEGEGNAVLAKKTLAAPRFPLSIGEHEVLLTGTLGADAIATRMAAATETEAKKKSDGEVRFEAKAKPELEPTTYAFELGRGGLEKLTIETKAKADNLAAQQLVKWLDEHAKTTPTKATKAWKLPGWTFTLHFGSDGDDLHYRLVAAADK